MKEIVLAALLAATAVTGTFENADAVRSNLTEAEAYHREVDVESLSLETYVDVESLGQREEVDVEFLEREFYVDEETREEEVDVESLDREETDEETSKREEIDVESLEREVYIDTEDSGQEEVDVESLEREVHVDAEAPEQEGIFEELEIQEWNEFFGDVESRQAAQEEILNACRQVRDTMVNRGVHYGLDDLVFEDIAGSYEKSTALCSATYVVYVLFVSGLIPETTINNYNYNWCGEGGIPSMLEDCGWKRIQPDQAQPGDVVLQYEVHAAICEGESWLFADKYLLWDENSCTGPALDGPFISDISECQVWRAPATAYK